jgi:hypothetical protein
MKGKPTTPNMAIFIRPRNFSFNNETSDTNKFQKTPTESPAKTIELAHKEFNNLIQRLIDAKINICVLGEQKTKITKPDAVFSNNWVVYMPNGKTYTMPMLAKNRRAEISEKLVIGSHYTFFETFNGALEGTGSMVFDHLNKKIYAAISQRTNEETLKEFAIHCEYDLVSFRASDKNSNEIYHTNVLMAVGESWAVLCKDVIDSHEEVVASLLEAGKEIIYITEDQMNNFCGNIFELRNTEDDLIIMMSTRAMSNFSKKQLEILFSHALVIPTPVDTIEDVGGGGVRCMITGSFL